MKANSHYAITLPREADLSHPTSSAQHAQLDLDLSLAGVQATWIPQVVSPVASPPTTSWLPHLDLRVAREFTLGSAQHDALWSSMESRGELIIRTNIDLYHFLRPVVQPGAKIDYEWPAEAVTLVLQSPQPISVTSAIGKIESQANNGLNEVRLTCSGDATDLIDLEIKLGSVLAI